MTDEPSADGIAIIGFAGRFPGAPNTAQFWENLRDGVESVSFFTDAELEASGIETARLPKNYVKARAILDAPEWFDAAFFGYTPREAEVLDPQQRVFLETAWEALEHAGYDARQFAGAIGVFAGMANNTYFPSNLRGHPELVDPARAFSTMIANEKDYLATRVSYKLNLTGPSVNVNTACSTSLVAVCQACQSLLSYQCDMALAGGVAIRFPQRKGSLYQEGGMTSADGHCRAFDERATGMVSGEGSGIVVLKRLSEALTDGDSIAAIIRGFAVNNDGADKVGYTAPSIDGQAEAVALAQAMGEVDPATISYVETHGTATPLGDPIEIAALTKAFRAKTSAEGYCAIGSVKTNIGHLDAAAGVAGLIKTVLALQHRQLPPSLHYTAPNPNIAFARSPFFVNEKLGAWPATRTPRRAGVSSFGIGGTNAHVVLEEAPAPAEIPHTGAAEVLVVSAKTGPALERACTNLAAHLTANPHVNIADVAHTLRVGRRSFEHRRAVVARTIAEAIAALGGHADGVESRTRGDRWLAGDAVDVHRPASAARRRIALPTYPFERQRFWVEPVRDSPRAEAPAPTRSGAPAPLATELRVLIAELATLPEERIGPSVSFLEIGFDSLFLTQISTEIERRFGVSVAFRLLQDELSTVERLAAFIAATRPRSPDVGRENDRQPPSAEPAIEAETPVEEKSFGPFHPAAPSRADVLSAELTEHIDQLTARYTARTARSKQLTAAHRAHLADPRSVSGFRPAWKEMVYPLVVQRSAGARLWDVDGHEYVDWMMGFGVNLFGHSPAFVTEALQEQLRRGVEIGPQSPLAGEVAEAICRMTGSDRAAFCNTGSEAVLAALRIARTVVRREKIALFAGSYHGIFDEVLVRAASGGRSRPTPIAPGIAHGMVANVIVLDYGDPRSLEIIREHRHELAAVLVEPVQSRHPDLQPVQFLRDLRTLTSETGIALVFDEIITGFRSHPGGAQALFGVRADIATYGKVIGGGMPLGVVAGQARFLDALDGGAWQYGDGSAPTVGVTYFAGTFVRHPLALAAAQVVLEQLERAGPSLQISLNSRTEALASSLRREIERAGLPVQIGQFSSLLFMKATERDARASLLFYHLREQGIHVWEGRPAFLSTAHSEEDVARIEAAFSVSCARLSATRASPTSVTLSLTDTQTDLWIATQMGDDASRSYNLSYLIHLRGALDAGALRAALQVIVDRHEALRTTFDGRGMTQCIAAQMTIEVPLVDTLAPGAPSLSQLVERDAHEAFDLEQGPLLRATIVRMDVGQHALLFTAHHLIVDGWSLGVLLGEMALVYSARLSGRPPSLPAPISSRAYAQQQMPGLEDAAIQNYWLTEFADPPPALDLPSNRPRPVVKTYRAATTSVAFEPERVVEWRTASARRGATSFTFLLATFFELLHRLSGQDDVVVGVPAAGQLTAEGLRIKGDRSLVGDHVNLLPIRMRRDSESSFAAHLAAVRARVIAAYEHQHFTFGELVRRLRLPRDPSRVPLVSVTFNLDRTSTSLHLEGLETELVSPPKAFDFFDLRLNLTEADGGLRVDCTFNTDLFDVETIRRWLGHWRTLLDAAAGEPERRLADLPLLTDTECEQLVREARGPDVVLPSLGVHELFEAQTRLTPEAIAVEGNGQAWSYRELDARANAISAELRRIVAGGDEPVGVMVERSPELVAALLAVLKAGRAYVPLDPAFPEARLRAMLKDAGARVLLTTSPVRADRTLDAATVIDTDRVVSLRADADAPSDRSPRDGLAYVIYTSGSTGQPKGVAISHEALSNVLGGMCREIPFQASDVFLAVTTISFDIAALEIFLPLITGARVVIASRETAADGRLLIETLMDAKATVLQGTPATWQMLIDAGWTGDQPLTVLCGGEAMPATLARELTKRSARVWNLYGPTETTIWSTAHRLDHDEHSVPIGRPLANTAAHVMDDCGQLVPWGVIGELCIGGAGLARGYWRAPDLTATRFVHRRIGDQDVLVYRTGDMARRRANGLLECLGRRDGQVKLRGFRIELGEIAGTLSEHPGVASAAATLHKHSSGDSLVGYVVPAGVAPPEADELRRWLRNRLPDYMIPSAIVALESLPRTANGKVDTRALPPPKAAAIGDSAVPQNTAEFRLATIWDEIFGDRATASSSGGIRQNFFDIGGDSLLAVRLLARVESVFGIRLPLAALFAAPTVELLAAHLRQPGVGSAAAPIAVLQAAGGRPPFFCVEASAMFLPLARALADERPFVGLMLPDDPASSMEALAAYHVEALRSMQPAGPYHVGGWSAMGVLAYEIARQLRAAGQDVHLLALFDCANPVALRESPERLGHKMSVHLRRMRELDFRASLAYPLRPLGSLLHQGRKRMRQITGEQLSPRQRLIKVLLASYHPQPYDGRMVLFRPSRYGAAQYGWDSLVKPDYEAIEVPGEHMTMFAEPHVQMLAARLRAALAQAPRAPKGSGS